MVTKLLREEDYDDENEDDDDEDEDNDNDDYGEEMITEVPQSRKCEDGFKKNENLECVGKCTWQNKFLVNNNYHMVIF